MRILSRFGFSFATAIVAASAMPAHALVPVGPLIQVNSNIAGDQHPAYGRAVAMHPDGSFVVAWTDYQPFQPSLDGDGPAIMGRRYDSTGSPLGDQFLVNTFTTGEQEDGAVAVTPDGGFIVAWGQEDATNPHIAFRRYNSSGASLGAEIVVASGTTDDTIDTPVDVAVAPDGSFLIVWSDEAPPVTGELIRARKYDSGGNASGAEFAVNTHTTGFTYPDRDDPAVASLGASGFVVVWNGPPLSGPYPFLDVIGRRIDSAGTPLAADFTVSGPNGTDDLYPDVAGATDGTFVVAWTSYDTDAYPEGVNARRFDSAGAPLGAELAVTNPTPYPIEIAVASEADGDFVVAWTQFGDAGNGYYGTDIFAREYSADGTPVSDPFSVSGAGFTAYNVIPSIATGGTGEFIVAWHGPDVGNDGAVIGQSDNVLVRRLGEGCSATPLGSCRAAANAKSSIFMKDNTSNSKDLLKWKWLKGAATDIADFGDPAFGTTDFRLCIYDGSGTGAPISEISIPPMGTCAGKPCWKAAATNYKYKDKDGTPSGVGIGKFSAGAEGKAKIGIVAKGANIPMPTLPLSLPVTVQLQVETVGGVECWGTEYGASTKNETAQFKAKGP